MTHVKNYFRRLADVIFDFDAPRAAGRVVDLRGTSAVIEGLAVPVGSRVAIEGHRGSRAQAEVVSLEGSRSRVALLERPRGAAAGAPVHHYSAVPVIGASRGLLGRAIDSLGRPVDGLGPVPSRVPVALPEPGALGRPLRRERSVSGVSRLVGAVELFRGARVAVSGGGGMTLADLALAHEGPVVAALVGGTAGSHAAFRWGLCDAGARTLCVLEPGGPVPLRARTAYRVAEALARFLAAEEERDAVLLVDWRTGVSAPVGEIAPVPEVTSFWSGVEPGAAFDAEYAPAADAEGRERKAS